MLARKIWSVLLSVFLSLLVFALIVLLFEIGFGLYTPKPIPTSFDKSLYKDVVGHELRPDCVITQTFHFPDGIHTARYTITQTSDRYTPVLDSVQYERFIALFGCSYIFGSTVDDWETIPAYIGQNQSQYMPYNYGKPGRALQYMYYHLLTRKLEEEITQEDGICLYLYTDFHFRRIIGGIPSPTIITANSLYIAPENNALPIKGTFREVFPWRWRAYSLMEKSNTLKYFNIGFPLDAPRQEDWDLIAALFIGSAKLFYATYPDSRFVIAFWGGALGREEITRRITASAVPVEILDLSRLLDEKDVTTTYFPDGHLVPKSNKDLAKVLIETLSLDDRHAEVVVERE